MVDRRTRELEDANRNLKREISDRKLADEALKEREERLQAILAASPDPMVMYDTVGNPQYLNPAFTQVFGWTLKEVEGRRIPFVPQDQKPLTEEMIRELYQTRTTARFETRRYSKGGRILDVIVSAAIIKAPDGTPAGMIVNLTDISQRKAIQTQYEQFQRMESIGTLAGGIAHDFNNLLTGIQGRTSLMATEPGISHAQREHIAAIEQYAESAADLARQLLGFARGGKYEVKPADLHELVASCAAMFGRTCKDLRMNMQTQDAPLVVEIDKRQIEQVLEGSGTILLVDDEDMILEVGRAMLEKLGYRVVAAKDGRQAVEAVRQRGDEFDLVLLDMIMPDMDGGKTFDRIREINAVLPVMLSSGYSIDGQAAKIMAKGCSGFIQKPFNISDLSQKIRSVLDQT